MVFDSQLGSDRGRARVVSALEAGFAHAGERPRQGSGRISVWTLLPFLVNRTCRRSLWHDYCETLCLARLVNFDWTFVTFDSDDSWVHCRWTAAEAFDVVIVRVPSYTPRVANVAASTTTRLRFEVHGFKVVHWRFGHADPVLSCWPYPRWGATEAGLGSYQRVSGPSWPACQELTIV